MLYHSSKLVVNDFERVHFLEIQGCFNHTAFELVNMALLSPIISLVFIHNCLHIRVDRVEWNSFYQVSLNLLLHISCEFNGP